jgi:hypothetical protein
MTPAAGAECGWLCQSFAQHSLAWLLLSTLVSGFLGGVIGAAVKFLFEDILRPDLAARRESRKVLALYGVPLCRAAETLEGRLNNLIRQSAWTWMDEEYYRLSTLYVFAAFAGWAYILESRFRFIGFHASAQGREVERGLRDVMAAFASNRRYFKWHRDQAAVSEKALHQFKIDALGEAMAAGGEPASVIGFAEFVRRYETDAPFRRWVTQAEPFFRGLADPILHDRAIIAGAQLRRLARVLDPGQHYVRSAEPRNLDLLKHPEIRESLAQAPEG